MKLAVTIQPDGDGEGYTGRECPQCERYFKVKFGTGLAGDLPCHCPYCDHTGPHDEFWTSEQIEYAESIALNKVSKQVIGALKVM